jgi:hypothetical protein
MPVMAPGARHVGAAQHAQPAQHVKRHLGLQCILAVHCCCPDAVQASDGVHWLGRRQVLEGCLQLCGQRRAQAAARGWRLGSGVGARGRGSGLWRTVILQEAVSVV